MSKIRYNKSKTYLLPLLSEIVGFDPKYFGYLQNTYIGDETGKYKDCLLVLHDFSFRNPEFTAYEHNLIKNESFVDLVDIDNKVLYIFKFPEEYMHEYNKFKEGKYGDFGIDAKELILDFFTNVYSGNANALPFLLKTKQILFRDKKLREQLEKDLDVKISSTADLSDTPDLDSEIFNIKENMRNKVH